MAHTHMVFSYVFEEAQKMITDCNHLMQQSHDAAEYHRELKLRWKQAFSMLRMARDLATTMDYDYDCETDEEDTDEEMPDLISDSETPQDAEMTEAQDETEGEVDSCGQRAEGSGC